MTEPFVAEIRVYPYNFAPKNWAFCDGQITAIQQNTALFSLLGTVYGGNGTTTFALPNLQGCAAMHPGTSATGSPTVLGETGGSATVPLTNQNMPPHTHSLAVDGIDAADQNAPSNQRILAQVVPISSTAYQASNAKLAAAATQTLPPYPGGTQQHNNYQPYLALNFCIALYGVYPARP